MTQASENQPPRLPLLNYLAELGRDYDQFFTFEETWRDDQPTDSIASHWLQRPSEKKSLQEELEQLHQTVPNFSYEIDKANPKIVHIMDARLAQQKGYVLESVIKKIDFKGKINDLPSEIGKQGLPVSHPLIMSIRETQDESTVVEVKGEGLKVRDALSNFIQLEGRRSRILWIARTKMGEGEMSYVHYP